MTLDVSTDGSVTVVSIERPHRRNAVDCSTARRLFEIFKDFERDASAHVAVLTGKGKHFCAGADLKEISEGRPNRLELDDGPAPMGPTRLQLSKPVIAAVSGYAVAGGLELAIWCDLRIADRTAKFGVSCRKWGVPLIDGGTVRLPRLIGRGRALDMILTGREVDAEEAMDIGLANRLVPRGEARRSAVSLAKSIADAPQICLRNDRLSVYEQFGNSEREAIENEFRRGLDTIEANDLEGAETFAESRDSD